MTEQNNQDTYEALAVECGDYFTFKFETAEVDLLKVKEFGAEIASGWGAELISVEKVEVNA